MSMNSNNVKEILKKNGHKYTGQRAKIFDVFVNHPDKHLSTEDVYEYISKDFPEIGIATIYRTLMLFEKLGILYKISFDDGVARYEIKLNESGHRHHHLVCLNCQKIIEVKLDLLDSLEKRIEKMENFEIVDHNLKFYGYCEECQKKEIDNEK